MKNTPLQRDLIAHCIEFMSDADIIRPFMKQIGLHAPKSYSYKRLALSYDSMPDALSLNDVRALFRNNWKPCDVDRLMGFLTSGLLVGHDWHKAMPSNLHLSFQQKVRGCCEGGITLEDYLSIGEDIAKHELFMTVTHDLCETSIIQAFPSVIPPIGNKSVTDFIFNEVPYDLKVTTHTPIWKPYAGKMTLEQKKELAIELYNKADSKRIRKDAEQCRNSWGLNRMYYVVNDQDQWLNNPKIMIHYLLESLADTSNFFEITIGGFKTNVCLIEQ